MTSFQAWYLPEGMSPPDDRRSVESAKGGVSFQSMDWTPDDLAGVLDRLRSEEYRVLRNLPVQRVVEGVDRAARRFLDPADPLRTSTLDLMAAGAGYSAPMAQVVLDGMAGGWVASHLERLLESEFQDPKVLDGFQPAPQGGGSRALGYPLAFHLGAGTVPGVAATSMVRSLLVKSAVLLRPGRSDLALSVAFAGALAEALPEVAGSMAVLYWEGDRIGVTESVLASVDLVAAYGRDETLDRIRRMLPLATPFVAYRHRLGVAMVGREALGRSDPTAGPGTAMASAQDAARAVALFDQRGCVSPHILFVEDGGEVTPGLWADLLAEALKGLESDLPSGPLDPAAGAAVQQIRGAAELADGLGKGWVRHGGSRGPWTVTVLPGEPLVPSCLNRVVRVVPVQDGAEAARALESWAPYLQSVGLEGFGDRTEDLEERLARLGASRIVSLASLPWPASWWHHDGGSPLRDLVRWIDIERM